MEIIDYLRILRQRVLVLVLVPVIAVAAAVAWALLKPAVYSGVATVNGNAFVGTSTSQFTGPQGVSQFVGAYGAAATGPQVLNVVSDQLDIPVKNLRSDLSVTQVGESATMRVAYSSADRDTVDPVLTAVVRETFAALFQPRAEQATRDLEAAQQGVKDANAAARSLADRQKVADPRQAYTLALGRVSNLQQQQATLRANGNSVAAAALTSAIRAAQADAAEYAPLLEEFETVEAEQNAAADALSAAQQESRLAEGQMASTESSRVVYLSGVSSAAAASDAWSLVLPVLGAALFTALVLVFVLELLSRAGLHQRMVRVRRRDDDGSVPAVSPSSEVSAATEPVPGPGHEERPAPAPSGDEVTAAAQEDAVGSGPGGPDDAAPEAPDADATDAPQASEADATDAPQASEPVEPGVATTGPDVGEPEGGSADAAPAPEPVNDAEHEDGVPPLVGIGQANGTGQNGSSAPRKGPRRRTWAPRDGAPRQR